MAQPAPVARGVRRSAQTFSVELARQPECSSAVERGRVGSLERQIYRVGVWSKATYSLVRHGVSLEAPLILVPADRTLYGGLRLIALVYLGIGLYVLLRRWTAPGSMHFYVFCLVSFIFYAFHYTHRFAGLAGYHPCAQHLGMIIG